MGSWWTKTKVNFIKIILSYRHTVQFSFTKSIFSLSKFKEYSKMYKLSPLILKNIHSSKNIVNYICIANESSIYYKRLKRFYQDCSGSNSIMCERFSESIHSIMKDLFSISPYIIYWTTPQSSSKSFLKRSLLNPLKQWETSGYKEWFTFTEFLSKFKKLLNKAVPENVNKKVLFQLWPEEHITMIVYAFLKNPNSVFFGTTHILLKTESLLQLEKQCDEKPCLVRNLPDNNSILVSFIKSKFLDLNRNRDIKIKLESSNDSDEEKAELNLEMMSKCSSRNNLLSRNHNSLNSKNSTTPSNMFNASMSLNSTLLPSHESELYK